jgi:hypothetical protein
MMTVAEDGVRAEHGSYLRSVQTRLHRIVVAVLERDPFAGAQAGGGGEQDHGPVARSELGGECLELAVRVERAHLAARRLGVVDAGLGRVAVDEAPLDGSGEGLWQAWVASKRCPAGSVIRQAAISCASSSVSGLGRKTAVDLASSQRSLAVVSG